jgi:hypothetical protein
MVCRILISAHNGKKKTTRIQDKEYAKEKGIEVTITIV